MKRVFSALLAALLLVVCPGTPVRAEAEATELRSAADLRAIADNPYGSYRLAADLDMGEEDWEPIPFYGTLDGMGHCLYNLRVRSAGKEVRTARDGNLKAYDTVFAGLFSVAESAEISNLRLAGLDVCVEGETHCFAGTLAGCAFDSVFRNCAVEGRVRLNNYAVMTGVGGAVGYGFGTLENCTLATELVFEDRNYDARCEEFMGGALGCGLMNIIGCDIRIDGYDSCRGYVHNGGAVGLYYSCGEDVAAGVVAENSISGRIRFFEDNPDRRAYCFSLIGESLSPASAWDNVYEFRSDEVWDYSAVLLPETCAEPSYAETVAEPGCETWGHTEHVCRGCGYHWTDSYTPPRHTPGEWVTEGDAERVRCAVCGTLLEERELPPTETPEPAPAPPETSAAVLVTPQTLTLRYKTSAVLAAEGRPAELSLVWRSTDPAVVTVNESGEVYAAGPGSAEVLCAAADGSAEGRCAVTVELSFWQWLIRIFLFGWLWY